MERQFDLNIEKILDNWENYHAVREIIANALDEMILTNTQMITVDKSFDGFWHIRDFGRGLQYKHLTQNESMEKKEHPSVIGKFGVGLKDAIAVLYKNGIYIKIISKHCNIEFGMRPKKGFPDTNTLHALISDSTNSQMVGTEFIIGVTDIDIEKAKSLFLVFSNKQPLDVTKNGEIYEKDNASGSIYVHGVKIAEEPKYIFDYNITKISVNLNKSLNRERSSVGRTAYSDIIKKILLNSKSDAVIKYLIAQLCEIPKGTNCEEILLTDVQLHAIKKYNAADRLIFISQTNAYNMTNDDKEKIRESGRKVVVIPDSIYEKVEKCTDYDGNEIGTFSTVLREYNENFKYEFVEESELSESEKYIFSLKEWVLSIYGNQRYSNRILVSENINEMTSGDILGVYESADDRIILKREILKDISCFCEVLFHELAHANTGYPDNNRSFENALGSIIGRLSKKIINDKK